MALFIEKSDRGLLEAISRRGSLSVVEIGETLGVTGTAVRQRLDRLTAGGVIERIEVRNTTGSRGRPSFKYALTESGKEALGHNLADLARALWSEIREIEDVPTRERLMQGVIRRMTSMYKIEVTGESIEERMQSLANCLRARDVVVSVDAHGDTSLPVLTINGCPYPGLAGQEQHDICEVEQAMFSAVLGRSVKLSECKCHSADGKCTFTVIDKPTFNATTPLESESTESTMSPSLK